jgi:serine-type D-Ala-D-Ala carboxypeptidase/endopeptidase
LHRRERISKMPTMSPLQEVLRRERRRTGLTQEELAERAGVAVTTVSRIEEGVTAPRIPTLRKIAQALELQVRDLLEEDE